MRRILSMLLSVLLILGFIPNIGKAIEASKEPNDLKQEIIGRKIKLSDGRSYTAFYFSDINDDMRKLVFDEKEYETNAFSLNLFNLESNTERTSPVYADTYKVRVEVNGYKDSNGKWMVKQFNEDFTFKLGRKENNIVIDGEEIAEATFENSKLKADGTSEGVEGSPFIALPGMEDKARNIGDNGVLLIPDNLNYEPKMTVQPDSNKTIVVTLVQRINHLFKSEWYVRDRNNIPDIDAYIVNVLNANPRQNQKMEFVVPKNDKKIYTMAANGKTYALIGKEDFKNIEGISFEEYGEYRKVAVTKTTDFSSEDAQYLGVFDDLAISLPSASAKPHIELGYGSYLKNQNFDNIVVGQKKYLLNKYGNYMTMWRFVVREALNVKFNTGNGKLEGGEANADIGTAQEIGYSEKIANNESGRAITLPTDELIPPAAEEGQPDNEFKGWALTADETNPLFKTQDQADAYTTPFTADVTTFYAIYGPVAQGKVKVEYLDESNKEIISNAQDAKDYRFISDKAGEDEVKDGEETRKLTLAEKYPAEKFGNKGETVKQELLNINAAPKFIGYKIKEFKTTVPPQGQKLTYTENGDYTIKYIYEKLSEIIPEKGDDGQPNPKVTEDVKATYIPVKIKVDSEKGKFQKNNTDVNGSEFIYYVNPVEGKKFEDVLTTSGLTAKSKDENANKIDAKNPWNFDPAKVKANEQEQEPSIAVAKDTKINKLHFTVEKGLVAEVNFGQTTADKYKDKLEPKDIKVWVGDNPINWKDGVKVKGVAEDSNENKAFKNELAKTNAKVEDLGENGTIAEPKTARTSGTQNLPDGKKGNLKVTFDDGSTLVVNDQTLYVADKKVPIKEGDETNKIDPKNLPDDKVAVKFLLGEGVQIGDDDTTAIKGKKDNPVLYTTYYVKPNTSLEDSDIPVTKAQKEYKDNKWYNGDAELKAEDYTNIKAVKTFTAKAVKLGTGKVLIKYYLDGVKKEDINEFKIDNEKYPTEVTGKENTKVQSSDIKQPELLGYKKAENNPIVIPADAKYLTTNPVEVKLNYTKIDDIVEKKPGDEKPAGYVTVTFKTADANKGKLWLETDTQTEAPTEKDKLFTELVYYVNPKANTIDLEANKLSAKKANGTEDINVVVNAKPENKYEVLKKQGGAYDWKLSVENAIVKDEEAQVNRVTKDLTLTVQYDGLYDREYKYVAVGTTKTLPNEIAQPTDTTKYPTAPIKLSEISKTLDTPAMHMLVIKDGTENKAVWFFDKWTRKVDDKNQLVTFTGEWKYFEPKGNETTVEQGGKPDPKDNISNNGDAPKDTKYEYDNDHKPDPNKIGEQDVVVIVEIPGPGANETTKIEVKTKVKIVEKRKDYGYFYEPSPDYLNTGAPAKKEEKVQEKYLEAYRWYVKGNDMGMFMPKKGITRAEVAQMFARALEYDKAMINVNITPYTDVDANAWYYEAVQKTSAAGIFKGSDKGTFMPTREITKAELIATIARFQHLSTKAGNTMNLQMNHWATPEVEAAYQEGWLDIYTNGTVQFAADEVITREEVVTILNRAFGRIADTKYIDDNAHTMTNFADATKDMWSYYEIMTAANTYLVDKMWVNHATKDNGPETLKEMIEWVKPLIDNKDVREVVEQVRFQR